MMNEYEVHIYIDSHLTGIEHHQATKQVSTHLYEVINDLTSYLKRKVTNEEWTIVRKIFLTAQHLYERGNGLVKTAIENVFVFIFHLFCLPTNRNG